MLFWQLDEIK